MNNETKIILDEYKLSVNELSKLASIPEKIIEEWIEGLVNPTSWVVSLLEGYLKQFPKNHNGIVTRSKGVYTVEQIKEVLLPLTFKYPIYQIVLCGDYVDTNQKEISQIDIIIEGKMDQTTVLRLTEEVKNLLLKETILRHENKINIWSDLYREMKNGIILYNRGMSINQVSEMIRL